MSEADDSLILSFVYIVVTFGTMYAGIRTSRWNTTRPAFWLGLIGYVIVAYLVSFLTEAVFSGEASLAGIATGIDFLVAAVLGFIWGHLAAGRTMNMGYSRNMAWITLIPVLGILWLGIAKPNHAKTSGLEDDAAEQN